MDRFEIETAILSVSTPGVHLGDDAEAREWARAVNDHYEPHIGDVATGASIDRGAALALLPRLRRAALAR